MNDIFQHSSIKLPYANSIDFLKDTLKKLDLQLELTILRSRLDKNNTINSNLCNNIYLNEGISTEFAQIDTQSNKDSNKLLERKLKQDIEQQSNCIKQRLLLNQYSGKNLPIQQLQKAFGLLDVELDILIICLAPYLDERYIELYTYLNNICQKTLIPLHLIFKILIFSFEERAEILAYLLNKSPLINWQCVKFVKNNMHENYTLLSIDKSILGYLLDGTLEDLDINIMLTEINTNIHIEELYLEDNIKNTLISLTNQLKEYDNYSCSLLYFLGENCAGIQNSIAAICNELNVNLYKINAFDIVNIAQQSWQDFDTIKLKLTKIIRKVILNHGYVLLTNAELLINNDHKLIETRNYFFKNLLDNFNFVFFTTTQRENFTEYLTALSNKNIYQFELRFSLLNYLLQNKIWQDHLNTHGIELCNTDTFELSTTFNFSEQQIKQAVGNAINNNSLLLISTSKLTREQLFQSCRDLTQEKFEGLASKKYSNFNLTDIVLPPETKIQLKELIAQRASHYKVYYEWNFTKRLSGKTGLATLFYGPPGTGKTMAASVLANELQLELYTIDLAMIMSKYIGETEKNLKKIFDAAGELNAILFFDEADALFSKRTEVKDSHDRHSNIEIGYLLQRIEAYQGIVILATNLLHNIDEAFVRRFDSYIEFPFPDKTYRKLIWQNIFPSEAPLTSTIDYDFLAEKIKLAGGNISNIALKAAFYAANQKTEIQMTHIIQAVEREYSKIGKIFTKSDYEPYTE